MGQGLFHLNQNCEALDFLLSFNDSAMSQVPKGDNVKMTPNMW